MCTSRRPFARWRASAKSRRRFRRASPPERPFSGRPSSRTLLRRRLVRAAFLRARVCAVLLRRLVRRRGGLFGFLHVFVLVLLEEILLGNLAIRDQVLSLLQIGVADEGVAIVHAFERFLGVEQPC